MAKRFITSLLKGMMGEYLEGLDHTEIHYSLSEAILQMQNVSVKEDALTKLKLPVQIKHGTIRRLDVSPVNFYFTLCYRWLGEGALENYIQFPRSSHCGRARFAFDAPVAGQLGVPRYL